MTIMNLQSGGVSVKIDTDGRCNQSTSASLGSQQQNLKEREKERNTHINIDRGETEIKLNGKGRDCTCKSRVSERGNLKKLSYPDIVIACIS